MLTVATSFLSLSVGITLACRMLRYLTNWSYSALLFGSLSLFGCLAFTPTSNQTLGSLPGIQGSEPRPLCWFFFFFFFADQGLVFWSWPWFMWAFTPHKINQTWPRVQVIWTKRICFRPRPSQKVDVASASNQVLCLKCGCTVMQSHVLSTGADH